MMTVGEMAMPAGFKYRSVYLKGKPRHQADAFAVKHPLMDRGRRAKIFSSFDALRGFSDAVAAKDTLYVPRPELSEEEQAEIGRRLAVLQRLTCNGRRARENRPSVEVEYFRPCADPDSDACGLRGQRVTLRGICRRVDGAVRRCVIVDGTAIAFADLLAIRAEGLFDGEPEAE